MLVVFDVDETLTKTGATDALVFVRAFADTCGVTLRPEDWERCRFVSDRGIAEEVLQRHLARPIRPEDIAPIRDHFLALLEAELPPASKALQVEGAAAILSHLQAAGHAVAIATGCWEASARLKLARARIVVDGIPLAASDDLPAREAILTEAIARAGGAERYARIVCVGDGPWDWTAARRLGLPFVGIDHRGTGRVQRLGVRAVLRDFVDMKAFLEAAANDP